MNTTTDRIRDAHGCSVADFAYSDLTTDDDEANVKFFAAARTDLSARDKMGLIALSALIEARDALFDFQASDAGMKVNVALAIARCRQELQEACAL